MKPHILSASILAADFANLGQDAQAMVSAGTDVIHFDVMDHHFVPNLSFGTVVCSALRDHGIEAPIDVHLMVDNPDAYIEPFAKAGADMVTFHPETVSNPRATLDAIRAAGMKGGLAYNPDKPIDIEDDLLASLDLVLIMSVYPGFGGQAFIPDVLEKIRECRKRLDLLGALNTRLSVDGGVKLDNIAEIAKAGADFFVLGSGLFNADNYEQRVTDIRVALEPV